MEYSIYSTSTNSTDAVIPLKAINILPFKKESLISWTEETDLCNFLYELYEGTGYGDISDNYFIESIETFGQWSIIFYEAAQEAGPSPASVNQEIFIPDFSEDIAFGYLAKNMSAWNNIVSNILSEGSFFSIYHILETRTDLNSSIHLAAHLYYKQAFQVLRSFIESIILPMYFCERPEKYKLWKNNNYSTPSLRGQKGILTKLVRFGVIDQDLSEKISTLYETLNQYIHGSEDCMNNKGLDTGNWAGFVFQYEEFNKWVNMFSTSIELGILILRQHHLQWERLKDKNENFCHICHSNDLIEKETENNLIEFTCKRS